MLKRPKILVAGSFNMDLTASCTRAPGSGETVIGKKFRTAPGGNGSVTVGENGIHHTACVKMPSVADPTAAGDSFVAAFCTVLAAGLPAGKALDFASYAAAITVTRMGAMPSLPTITEVQELLRERGYEDFDLSLLDVLH